MHGHGIKLVPGSFFGSAILAGIRYVALSPALVTVMLRSAIFNIAAIGVLALLPLIARDILGGGPQTFGFLLGAFGVGAVVGSLFTNVLRGWLSLEPLLAVGYLGFSACCAVLAVSHNVAVSFLAACVAGAGRMLVQVTLYST